MLKSVAIYTVMDKSKWTTEKKQYYSWKKKEKRFIEK